MRITFNSCLAIAAFALCISCTNHSLNETKQEANYAHAEDSLHFTVEEAPEWTALFKRQSGWFGGDGIFAVTRDGKENPGSAANSETVIWFSDTMLGEIEGDSLQPGFGMINNSVAVLKDGIPDATHIHFLWKKKEGKNASVFVPQTPATQKGDYYWLGDGFVNQEKNNDLYIFGYRIRNTDAGGSFGFKEVGNTLIITPGGSEAPFENYRQIDIPFFLGKETDSTGSFGAGVFVNTKEAGAVDPDGYVYIYGVRGKNKQVMVARVKPADIESFDQWRFWDGSQWNTNAFTMAAVADRASNELGVMRLTDGRYALVFQTDGIGRDVGLRLGKSPVGPFGPIIKLWDTSKDLEGNKNLFPYNAKVHPVLSKPDEMLISYNINSFDFKNDILRSPNLYRPRFIRVKVLP